MTRAALYVRMSTDHQDDSPEVQIARGKALASERGWDVVHIYQDDARSRAEFVKRPGLSRLLADAGKRFDALIMRDDDRLGGDIYRTGLALMSLVEAGVRVWYYASKTQVSFADPTSKLMQAVKGYASEIERVKTSERTRESHAHKAQLGYVTGGVVYGYSNVEVLRSDGSRDHVERVIDPDQAAIVVRICNLYTRGDGIRAIAHALNDQGIASPRAGRVGTGSWSPSCVREILRRPLYRGIVVWGQTRKGYRGGTKIRTDTPAAEHLTRADDRLRIVSPELAAAVDARMREPRHVTGSATGRTPKYLLTGFARCAECGGPIRVTESRNSKRTVPHYGCGWHRDRGESVCSCSLRRPVDDVDAVVLQCLREDVLCDRVVEKTLRWLRRLLSERATQSDTRVPELTGRIADLDDEIRRLTAAVLAAGASPAAIVSAIADRERQRDRLRGELEALRAAPGAIDLEMRRLERDARSRIDELREMTRSSIQEARQALAAVLDGPLTMAAIETRYGAAWRITGSGRLPGATNISVPKGAGSYVVPIRRTA